MTQGSWSIAEVARLSGVTSRTLRHYDEIGLLSPARTGANGLRYYESTQLLRLQRILVLRELGLGLREIAGIVDAERDALRALREHHDRLRCESARLAAIADTVARTITELEAQEGTDMAQINRPENLFEGFDPGEYDAEAQERWPAEYEQSKQFSDTLSPADVEQMQREQTAAMVRMAELMAPGTPVTDATVQAEVDAAYRGICRFWTPDARALRCLGQMYVDDPRFTATYDRVAIGLAAYYRDAMGHYADTRLG